MGFAVTGRRAAPPRDLHFGTTGSPPSEVTTRMLTPEERVELESRLRAKKGTPEKKPVLAPNARSYPKGSGDMPKKRDINEYLHLRASGFSIEDIAAQWGVKAQSIRNNQLYGWGLKDPAAEQKAIDAYLAGDTKAETPGVAEPDIVVEDRETELTHDEAPKAVLPVLPIDGITLTFTARKADKLPESVASLTNLQLTDFAVDVLCEAIYRVTETARELLGRDDVGEVVADYIKRSMEAVSC